MKRFVLLMGAMLLLLCLPTKPLTAGSCNLVLDTSTIPGSFSCSGSCDSGCATSCQLCTYTSGTCTLNICDCTAGCPPTGPGSDCGLDTCYGYHSSGSGCPFGWTCNLLPDLACVAPAQCRVRSFGPNSEFQRCECY